jgi:hypothetical protein
MNDFVYTKAGTDITIRWKKLYNYSPASEQDLYKKKWAEFRDKCNKGIDDLYPTPIIQTQILKWKRK